MNRSLLRTIRLSFIKIKLIKVTEGRVYIVMISKRGSYQDDCFAI